jgi:hypothetical protein
MLSMIPIRVKIKPVLKKNGNIFMSDILFKVVYLAQDQLEIYIREIKSSNLPKPLQWDLIDLLKDVQEHTEMARQMGWVRD